MLDYRIKDLKKQIEPREKDIENMRREIKTKDLSLESLHHESASLTETISDLNGKVTYFQEKIDTRRLRFRTLESKLARFHATIHEAMRFIQDPKNLLESVSSMYSQYVSAEIKDRLKSAEIDSVVTEEYTRQKSFLEKSITILKSKLNADMDYHSVEHRKIMLENVGLVKEINDLRKEIKVMKQHQRDLEMSGEGESTIEQEQHALAEISRQRDRIKSLTDALNNIKAKRPASREILPPIR